MLYLNLRSWVCNVAYEYLELILLPCAVNVVNIHESWSGLNIPVLY